MNDKVSNKISFISLIIVFGIVIYHSGLKYVTSFYGMLSMVYMPWFFMISGYFAARGFSKEERLKRLKRRFFTLLLPYILWNLIQLAFGYIRSGFTYKIDIKDYILGFLFSPACIPTWYLFSVFVLIVLFFVFKPLFMGKKLAGLMLAISFLISVTLFAWFPNALMIFGRAGGFLYKTVQYLPAFMIGAFAAEFDEKIILVNSKKWIVFAGLALVDIVIICLIPEDVSGTNYATLLLTVLVITVNIFNPLLWLAVPEKIFSGGRLAQFLTAPSLFLCMSHIMLLEIWSLVYNFPKKMRYQLIVVPSAVITSVLLFYIMKRFTPRILNLLTGGRAVKSRKK